jgi:hypothetical protein
MSRLHNFDNVSMAGLSIYLDEKGPKWITIYFFIPWNNIRDFNTQNYSEMWNRILDETEDFKITKVSLDLLRIS